MGGTLIQSTVTRVPASAAPRAAAEKPTTWRNRTQVVTWKFNTVMCSKCLPNMNAPVVKKTGKINDIFMIVYPQHSSSEFTSLLYKRYDLINWPCATTFTFFQPSSWSIGWWSCILCLFRVDIVVHVKQTDSLLKVWLVTFYIQSSFWLHRCLLISAVHARERDL